MNAEFSPDGAWVAYSSGIRPTAVYVRPFPLTGAVYQVSNYVPGPDGLVRVTVNRSPFVSFSDPSALPRNGFFESPVTSRNIDLGPDGDRLLGVTTGDSDAPFMQIVLNWFEELNRLAPATRSLGLTARRVPRAPAVWAAAIPVPNEGVYSLMPAVVAAMLPNASTLAPPRYTSADVRHSASRLKPTTGWTTVLVAADKKGAVHDESKNTRGCDRDSGCRPAQSRFGDIAERPVSRCPAGDRHADAVGRTFRPKHAD